MLGYTTFGKVLAENSFNLLDPARLQLSDKYLPFVIVGDDAFQLSGHLMKTYSQIEQTEE